MERNETEFQLRMELNITDVSFINRVEEFEHLIMIGTEREF